ncbi:MerR family transcriptional regulator [Deinococcus sonorensis]|uniref:MerR family transcriptional regulator n=2 Tax=Deinococcus sonorensis TaxID=309891 RepID=A0AAU7U708_9DEIO
MNEHTKTWRIGELAVQAGITVRTLHHYDRLGLLSPATRTSGSHRCYTADDVARLQRIIALRSCGLTLQETAAVLQGDAGGGVADLLRRQLDVVNERARQAVDLQARLRGILNRLERNIEPSIDDLLRLIEDTTRLNTPWTAEQVARLRAARALDSAAFAALNEQRRQVWGTLTGDEQTRRVEQRRAAVSASGDTRS